MQFDYSTIVEKPYHIHVCIIVHVGIVRLAPLYVSRLFYPYIVLFDAKLKIFGIVLGLIRLRRIEKFIGYVYKVGTMLDTIIY